ncbi:hypothetical protein B0H16DRAFT_1474982 [Mycena metata]|uniref:Uncharacterized protein n=1 Tax=Mycena metata TaxID=1033252 RepID=A0AAD7MIQ9_9AGAR|nr:hypothetical protein B0H16DRAFT_1474982 [Mycena metata]
MSAANNNQKGAISGSSRGNGDGVRGRRGYPEDQNSEEGRRATEADAAAKKHASNLAEIQDEEQLAKKQIEDMEHLDSSKAVAYACKIGIGRSVIEKKLAERGVPPGSTIKVRTVATSSSLVESGIRCSSSTGGPRPHPHKQCELKSKRSEDLSVLAEDSKLRERGQDRKQIPDPNHLSHQRILRNDPLTRMRIVVLHQFLLQLLKANGEEAFHTTRVRVAEEIRDFKPRFSWAMSHRPVAPVYPFNQGEKGPLPSVPQLETWGLFPAKSLFEERELETDLARYDRVMAKAREFILGNSKDGEKGKEKEEEDNE